MLKSVLSSMPSYSMSCFKLPVSLCSKIQSLLTRFWWDKDPDKKKISWVAWTKLTVPKNAGGLGFRELENFNDALLAKLGWRLLKYPNSLLSRILLNKYCKETTFMNCTLPSRPSHGWRSIIAGREILRQGLGWLIASGDKVRVWQDPWLSLKSPITPYGPVRENLLNMRVSELIDQTTKQWNWTIIHNLLPDYANLIRQLPPGSFHGEDKLAWLPGKSGEYTTKSGYGVSSVVELSTAQRSFNWQGNIWRIKTLPKIKSFLWKAAMEALPVGTQLIRRGIEANANCSRCGAPETIGHVLFQCEFAMQVWEAAPISGLRLDRIESVQDFLTLATKLVYLPPAGIYSASLSAWICWYLWTSRNQIIFSDKHFSVIEIVTKASQESIAWQSAQLSLPKLAPNPPASNSVPPLTSGLYCLVDAAWKAQSYLGGFGWVFQSSSGEILSQVSGECHYLPSALMAEAWALKLAMSQALESGRDDIMFLSDSQSLVKALKTKDYPVELYGILIDIFHLQLQFYSASVNFIPRKANFLADALAKKALCSFETNIV